MKRAPVYIHRPNKPSARYDYPYDHLPHFKSRVHPIYVTAYLYRTLKCLRHSTLEMSHRLSQHMSMMRSLKCVWNDRPLLDFVDEEWRGPHRLVFLDGLEPTFFDDFPCCKDLEGFTIDDIDLDADFDDDHSDIYDLESAKTQTGSFSPPSPARYPTRHEAWRLGIIRWASDVSLYALSPASSDYDAEDTSYPDDPIRSFDDAFCACDPRVISTVRYTIRLRDHWRYSSNDWTFLATGIPLTLPVPSPKHWGELPYFDSGIPG
ncbi:hypothetical protein VKT23_007962 [Stygiomarasmius scandens]|uniref:Uncharacterized protein n=1 Tax=Marasmiellus scandens TaxID=2682957 RepID=A0ABR1JIX3_9AGAR